MFQRAKNIYHLYTSVLANAWLRFPSRKLTVIGVTGTDGKTTTVNLIYHILKTAGLHVSMVSTVGAILDNKIYDVGFHVTTPSGFEIQRFMKGALTSGNSERKYMILEVSSHGLDQNRVWGVPFSIGVITNITHEHIDYHKTYDNYVKTKVKLLQRAKTAIINRDDISYPKIISLLPASKHIVTYGMKQNADLMPGDFIYKSSLPGVFNHYNILAAVATARELDIADDIIRNAIKTFKPPIGRVEIVYDKNFTVMIDFAHTPNAFSQILQAIKPMVKGRLIHVFGSAGKRDAAKRPMMGEISSEFTDIMILTSEDPRDENPYNIIKDIEFGIPNSKFRILDPEQAKMAKEKENKYLFEIPDRKKAIEFAVNIVQKGDFILFTGKAHEKSINYGNGEESWDEFKEVQKALSKIKHV